MKSITKNKNAYREYEITVTYEAGIVLSWHEVKSIKMGRCQISDWFVKNYGTELYLHNMDIPLYPKTLPKMAHDYDPKHNRKLLLHTKEIQKLIQKSMQDGYTIVPLEVIITHRGLIKVLIGLWRGLKTFQKKQLLKEKDIDKAAAREIQQIKKDR